MIHLNRIRLFLLLFIFCSHSAIGKSRALVIGIDGLKSTELHRSMYEKNMAPNIRDLTHSGVSALCPTADGLTCARAHDGFRYRPGYKWATGPGWAAVITGLNTEKHQIKGNGHKRLTPFFQVTQRYPSMFKIVRDAHLTTAIGGVGAFLTSLNGETNYPGIVDYECGIKDKGPAVNVSDEESCNATYRKALRSDSDQRDEDLAQFLIEQIKHKDTDLIMGVLDLVDTCGHTFGFGNNPEYLNAIERADELVGRIVSATKETKDEWLYIIVSDHGGHTIPLFGGAHNHVLFEDEVVPFIVAISNKTPLKPLRYPVRHMDVHPTVLAWLGLGYSSDIDGRVQGIDWNH